MNKKRIARWSMACTIIFIFCTLIGGCAQTKKPIYHVTFNKNRSVADMQLPANFVIKLGGQTKYTTYDGKEILVGEILKEDIEKRINKIKDFSTDRKDVNQYMIGIYIREYDPKIKQLKEKLVASNKLQHKTKSSIGFLSKEEDTPPIISCEVSISKIEKNINGEQIIGEKLCVFNETKVHRDNQVDDLSHYLFLDSITDSLSKITAWKDIITVCSYRISETVEAIFNQ